MTNQDKISALGKAVAEIETLAMNARTLATDNSMNGANTVAQDFEILVRSLEMPYLQLLESLEHEGVKILETIDARKNTADTKARPSPVHFLNDAGEWVLPSPAKPPTTFEALALPTGELAAPPVSIPETIQPAPHAPRRRMAGTF